jgi:hypothetical protein
MSDVKRVDTSDRLSKGESLDKGKRPRPFKVNKQMCVILYCGNNDEYLFVNGFLTMAWNLMARSDKYVLININHVQ